MTDHDQCMYRSGARRDATVGANGAGWWRYLVELVGKRSEHDPEEGRTVKLPPRTTMEAHAILGERVTCATTAAQLGRELAAKATATAGGRIAPSPEQDAAMERHLNAISPRYARRIAQGYCEDAYAGGERSHWRKLDLRGLL